MLFQKIRNFQNPFSKNNIFRLLIKNYVNQMINQMLQLPGSAEFCADPNLRGLVLGVYADVEDKTDNGFLTASANRYNNDMTQGRMVEVLRMSGRMPDVGECRLLFCVEPKKIPYYHVVAVAGLGRQNLGYDNHEIIDENKEAIRRSVAQACKKISDLNIIRIDVESCGHAESAAEGAAMGIWTYQDLKNRKKRKDMPSIDLYTHKDELCDVDGWRIGLQKAAAQNFARQMQECPSNHLTPTAFAEKVVEVLCKSGINVEVKSEGWAEDQKMRGFLAVGRASCEAPLFLELTYYGGPKNDSAIVLVGQGITYDCGGLDLKENKELKIMRGDVTGAAVVVATCKAISELRLPVNIRALIPLCENVMGCNALKPGDVVKCMNGKTIQIQACDHEDVIVLADALLYAQNFCPKFIIDIGTTSGAMRQTLDEGASGVFTNSEILWQQIKNASIHTGDRVWRLPLWNYYTKQMTSTKYADVQNFGIGHKGNPCKAAAFLRQFVPCGQWMHIDATNVMYTDGKEFQYLRHGMTGRPTRTIIELIAQTVCKDIAPKITSVK